MEPCPRALLTFGDSSGNPSRPKRGYEDTAHHVTVTTTMEMRGAQRVDAQAQAPMEKHLGGLNPDCVPFHANRLRHKLICHTGNRHLAEQLFNKALEDIVNITKDMDSTINMVVMDKLSPARNYKPTRVVTISWAHASEMMRRTLLRSRRGVTGIVMPDRHDDPASRPVAHTMAPPRSFHRSGQASRTSGHSALHIC